MPPFNSLRNAFHRFKNSSELILCQIQVGTLPPSWFSNTNGHLVTHTSLTFCYLFSKYLSTAVFPFSLKWQRREVTIY